MKNNMQVDIDIRVIVNYFGKPLPYFQLWLDSCAMNKEIRWIFITDINMSNFDVPKNVEVVKTTFELLRKRIQKALPYRVRYEKPWDFCALRPVFGTIFSQEIGDAAYWGWADCDIIYGDLRPVVWSCIKGDVKIMPKGHFSLVKNDERMNRFIMEHPLANKALAINESGLPCFDEVAFPSVIINEYGGSQNNDIPFINTACRYGNYVLDDTDALYRVLKINQKTRLSVSFVVTLQKGKMIAHFALSTGKVCKVEVVYFHFFRRELTPFVSKINMEASYLICPNKIQIYDGHELGYKEIKSLNRFRVHWRYFFKRLNWRTLQNKVVRFFAINMN